MILATNEHNSYKPPLHSTCYSGCCFGLVHGFAFGQLMISCFWLSISLSSYLPSPFCVAVFFPPVYVALEGCRWPFRSLSKSIYAILIRYLCMLFCFMFHGIMSCSVVIFLFKPLNPLTEFLILLLRLQAVRFQYSHSLRVPIVKIKFGCLSASVLLRILYGRWIIQSCWHIRFFP